MDWDNEDEEVRNPYKDMLLQKITLIKHVRRATNCGLVDAKDVVEYVLRNYCYDDDVNLEGFLSMYNLMVKFARLLVEKKVIRNEKGEFVTLVDISIAILETLC
jgi:hypothetical protein